MSYKTDLELIISRISDIQVSSSKKFEAYYNLLNSYFYGDRDDLIEGIIELKLDPNTLEPATKNTPIEMYISYLENSSPTQVPNSKYVKEVLQILMPSDHIRKVIVKGLLSIFSGKNSDTWGEYFLQQSIPVKAFCLQEISTMYEILEELPEIEVIRPRDDFNDGYPATRDKCIAYLKSCIILTEHKIAGEKPMDFSMDTKDLFLEFIENFWLCKRHRIELDWFLIFSEIQVDPEEQIGGLYPLELFIQSALVNSQYALWDGGFELKQMMYLLLHRNSQRMGDMIKGMLSIIEGINTSISWGRFSKDNCVDLRFFIATRLTDESFLSFLIPEWKDYDDSIWIPSGSVAASRDEFIRYLRYIKRTSYVYE